MSTGLQKRYGLLTAICMVVGIVIGSGVFFKAPTILQATGGSMPLGILAWIIGGLIMMVCALSFGSMATKYERVNGIVDYAEATIGPKYAYIVGWFMTTMYYPVMSSAVAWLSARFTLVFIKSMSPGMALTDGGVTTGSECMALTLVFLCAAYALNVLSPKIAGHYQVSTTIIKMIPLLLMAVIGIIYGLATGQLTENFTVKATVDMSNEVVHVNPLFSAVVSAAFAYDGWIVATSINAELKDSKRNLPIALAVGSVIVMLTYTLYYIGVSGGASNNQLLTEGTNIAFTNIFGNIFGNILNLFVAISCTGTLNGLMLGGVRGMYSITTRGYGPSPEVFCQVDNKTGIPGNSGVAALLLCAFWFIFFYGSNLAPVNWFGFLGCDASELVPVTLYIFYIPMLISFMRRGGEGFGVTRRYIIPSLALLGSGFMALSAIFAHGIKPYVTAAAEGKFSIPLLAFAVFFAVFMLVGLRFYKRPAPANADIGR